MNKIFLLLILFFLPCFGFAQSDVDEDQHQISLLLFAKNFIKAKEIVESRLLKSDDNSRKVIGYVYLSRCYDKPKDESKKIEALENAKKIALKTRNEIDMAYVKYGYALYYAYLEKNDFFVKTVNESISTFSKFPKENFILSALFTSKFLYLSKNKLNRDEKYTKMACISAYNYALKSKNDFLIFQSANNVCAYYAYQHLTMSGADSKKYRDSAVIYIQKTYSHIQNLKDKTANKRALITYYFNLNSLADNSTESISESLKLYDKILDLTENDDSFKELRCATYNNIAILYENENKNKLAEEYYLKAYELIPKSKVANNYEFSTVKIVSFLEKFANFYEKMHQPEKELKYLKEARSFEKQGYLEKFENSTKSLELFYETEKKDNQIRQLEEKDKMYNKYKLLSLFIILLSIVGVIFLFYMLRYRQKHSKQKISLLEAEKSEANLLLQLTQKEQERLKAEQELLEIQQEQLQKHAMATSLQLDQKNTFINEIKEKAKGDKNTSISRALKEEQLIDHDFNVMQKMVQDVHPDFFKRLQEIAVTKLTNQDLRYASYIYLNMDNQQISNILKSSPMAVRMTKYRLKQKLGLDKNDDLKNFIQNLKL